MFKDMAIGTGENFPGLQVRNHFLSRKNFLGTKDQKGLKLKDNFSWFFLSFSHFSCIGTALSWIPSMNSNFGFGFLQVSRDVGRVADCDGWITCDLMLSEETTAKQKKKPSRNYTKSLGTSMLNHKLAFENLRTSNGFRILYGDPLSF